MEVASTTARRTAAVQILGVAVGIATHVLFAYTVWFLFWFLKDGSPAHTNANLWLDSALALLFAVPHSLLLWPPAKKFFGNWIPTAFYGLFYTTVTCVTLLILFSFWHGSNQIVWQLHGRWRAAASVGFYGSWIALIYSLHLTGLGYQTGLTPWLRWTLGLPQLRREFRPRGAYRLLRHPVYLSFMGLVWFVPHMSYDHVVLTAVWSAYLMIGSWLKDRRLTFYLGDSYQRYQENVTGYPLMPFGPLARRRSSQ